MMQLPSRIPCRSRQSGVGLIEVLIAVLVVSIGFLGMAALQARALSTNNSAMARSMATVASYSILDAMRADISNALDYNGTMTADSCTTVPAGASGLAESQLEAWCSQLAGALGAKVSTTGEVDCSDAGDNVDCTITIQFDDSRAGDNPTGGGSATQKVVTRAVL